MSATGEPGPYRLVVIGVSTTVNALAWAARSTFALFYVAILDEFAWGRGPTALGYSLSWLCFVVFAPVAGCTQSPDSASAWPFLGGWLFDATGSYQLAFAAASFAIAGSAVAAWIAVPSPALSRCGRHARIWVRRVVKHAGHPRR